MGRLVCKAIGLLLVIGVIFFAGVFVGGGFASGTVKDSVKDRIVECTPIKNADEVGKCLAEEGAR